MISYVSTVEYVGYQLCSYMPYDYEAIQAPRRYTWLILAIIDLFAPDMRSLFFQKLFLGLFDILHRDALQQTLLQS